MADGHLHTCKECDRARAREYWAKHRDRLVEAGRQRYAAKGGVYQATRRRRYREDPEYRAHRVQLERDYCARHPDRVQARSREYFEAHRAERLAYLTDWQRGHPDLRAEHQRRYRSRRKGDLAPALTMDEWAGICEQHGNACAYCGSTEDMTMDHQLPVQRGGRHDKDNVVPACRSCNTSKGEMTPTEWAAAGGRGRHAQRRSA